jgi:uncharacterized protein (UPF0261 family)
MGKGLAQKVNRSAAAAILLPLKGISQIDAPGGVFHRPDIDQVLFEAIKEHAEEEVSVMEVDAHINDNVFAETAVKVLLNLVAKSKARQQQ